MPQKRVIACLIVKGGIVVQSIGFRRYLPVGRAEIAARYLDAWGVDEIVLVDTDASPEGRLIDPALVGRVAGDIFVPLAVGGGIRSVDDIRALLNAGADKVVLNRTAVEAPRVVSEAARIFGTQCVVASLDARRIGGAHYEVFIDSGRQATGQGPPALARSLEDAGAGELLLNSIDRDGSRRGYDLDLVLPVAGAVNVPVICFGGAGHPAHLLEALRRDEVSAAAAGNFLHYTEHSVAVIKSYLRKHGIDVRTEHPGGYLASEHAPDGRLAKRDEAELDRQIFEHVQEEFI